MGARWADFDSANASYEVTPGQHEISLRIDWCGSETLSINLQEGARLQFKCYPNDGFRQAACAILSNPHQWIMLELVDA
jgi:hypothetical protein